MVGEFGGLYTLNSVAGASPTLLEPGVDAPLSCVGVDDCEFSVMDVGFKVADDR